MENSHATHIASLSERLTAPHTLILYIPLASLLALHLGEAVLVLVKLEPPTEEGELPGADAGAAT